MKSVSTQHVILTDEGTFWNRCVFDREYNRRLYAALRFPTYVIERSYDDGIRIYWMARVTPKAPDIPFGLGTVIGDNLSYVERGVFDKTRNLYTFEVLTANLTDKVKIDGKMWSVGVAGKRECIRKAVISINVDMPILGGTIEEYILASLAGSYDTAAEYANRYIQANGLSA